MPGFGYNFVEFQYVLKCSAYEDQAPFVCRSLVYFLKVWSKLHRSFQSTLKCPNMLMKI